MRSSYILLFIPFLAYAGTTTVGGVEMSALDAAGIAGVTTINTSRSDNIKILPYGIRGKDMKTIKAHTRTADENKNHQTFCLRFGGIDVTDDSDVQMSGNTIDAIFCKIVDSAKFASYNKKYGTGNVGLVDNGKLVPNHISQTHNGASNGQWQAFAPNGIVSGPYYATGVGAFHDLYGAIHLDVSVPSDRCSGLSERAISGDSQLTVTLLCGFFSGGSQPSYTNACFNGSCVQDRGWITHTQ